MKIKINQFKIEKIKIIFLKKFLDIEIKKNIITLNSMKKVFEDYVINEINENFKINFPFSLLSLFYF